MALNRDKLNEIAQPRSQEEVEAAKRRKKQRKKNKTTMKTKPYTDYEQSTRLAKFLHTETADMYWLSEYGKPLRAYLDFGNFPTGKGNYWPCWSLDALMKLLPEVVTVFDEETTDDEDGERDYTDYKLNILKENEEWIIFYEEDAHSALDHDWLIDERGEHLIDAAYNIIVELHNKGLL